MPNIKLVDLERQLLGDPTSGEEGIKREIDEAINRVINNTSFIMGPELEEFEAKFAEYCEAKYCVGLNSGTDALEFALRCNDITSGEVITVPNSYFTTASSISQAGATPRFIDVDKENFNMDINKVNEAVTSKTRAIIAVHLYGLPCNMDPILDIGRKYRLKIIEDCAHAHGARYKGQRVPISKTGAFSFFPGKNLGCWGDGGALVTDDIEVARLARLWRNDGSEIKYYHEILGRKARLDSLQAAILSVKLRHLEGWNSLRRQHAELYHKLLSDISGIQLPLLGSLEYTPVFHIYNIITSRRDELATFLSNRGISTGVHYPNPIHLQPAYKHFKFNAGSFPITEYLSKRTLSLPMFPELRDDEIKYISTSIKDFFSNNKFS